MNGDDPVRAYLLGEVDHEKAVIDSLLAANRRLHARIDELEDELEACYRGDER